MCQRDKMRKLNAQSSILLISIHLNITNCAHNNYLVYLIFAVSTQRQRYLFLWLLHFSHDINNLINNFLKLQVRHCN